MGCPSPARTKAFTSSSVGGQTANWQQQIGSPTLTKPNQPDGGEDLTQDSKAPDVATQLTHALQFGHNFSQTVNRAPIQRQSQEEDEIDRKPDASLQRQASVEEEEDLSRKPEAFLQHQASVEEEEEKLDRKPDSSLRRQATPEEEEEIHPKLNVAELQRRQNEEEEIQRQQEDDEELRPKLIQTKLTIGQPGDKYEQEADRMAAKVMAMPEPQGLAQAGSTGSRKQNDTTLQRQINVSSLLQRETLEEKKDDELAMKPLIQLKGQPLSAPNNFESQLAQHKGSGQPLSDDTRAFMEPRFGADFSGVRVHETPDLASAIQAQAFTHGQDIYFNSGKYNLGSSGGKGLLAHELTHVVQQTLIKPSSKLSKFISRQDFRTDLSHKITPKNRQLVQCQKSDIEFSLKELKQREQLEVARTVLSAIVHILEGAQIELVQQENPEIQKIPKIYKNALWSFYKGVHSINYKDGKRVAGDGESCRYWLESGQKQISSLVKLVENFSADWLPRKQEQSLRKKLKANIELRIHKPLEALFVKADKQTEAESTYKSLGKAQGKEQADKIRKQFPNGISIVLSIPDAYIGVEEKGRNEGFA